MKIQNKKFADKILSLYSEENLNRITTKIIEAYKNKHFSYIIGVCNLIDDSLVKKSQTVQKLFSHLILLYHPDRTNLYKQQILSLIKENKFNEIEQFHHIISVTENLDNIQYSIKEKEIEYEVEFEYGYDSEDFDSIIGEKDLIQNDNSEFETNFDFISVFKYREFGSDKEDFPSYYLEQLEGELNLSNSNLFDLSGLEVCSNISNLDLSKNNLIDINQIGFLVSLTDLNLSENAIQSIDVLRDLSNLQKLDISFNEIEDIGPLFDLPNLEYVNVIGNEVSEEQLEILKKKKIILVY